MANKIKFPHAEHLVERYLAGASLNELAKEHQSSILAVKNALMRNGVAIRTIDQARRHSGRSRRRVADMNAVIAMYDAGMSLKAISGETGLARTLLKTRLMELGVPIRGRSAAETLKWEAIKRDWERVVSQCGAAWAAARLRTDTAESKAMRAFTRFQKQLNIFPIEDTVAIFLEAAGFRLKRQKNCGPYNVDISLDGLPVSVEVIRYSPSQFNAGRAKTRNGPQTVRLKYLLDHGWFVVCLIGTGHSRIIDLAIVGGDLIASLQTARNDRAAFGHYRVIWGQGKAPPRSRYNFDGLPAIE